jgi:hypothetical protein
MSQSVSNNSKCLKVSQKYLKIAQKVSELILRSNLSGSIGISSNSSERRDSELLGALGGHHDESASAVVERRCVSGRDCSVFFERSAKISEFRLVESSEFFVNRNRRVRLSALARDNYCNSILIINY